MNASSGLAGQAYLLRIWVIGLWLLASGGCSLLQEWRQSRDTSPVQEPTDRFALTSNSMDVVGEIQVTKTESDDTLLDIARRYNLGYEEIVAANPSVDPWLPGENTPVVLPTQFILPSHERKGLVLNLASMRLFYFPEPQPGQPAEVITHPIGIGREGWNTPVGLTHITQKKENPAWTVPESVRREHAAKGTPLPRIVPAGPDNPLGAFAMRLSQPQYLIHGTNRPFGVGLRVSHGCVRLYPEDIARLFPQVPVGTPVRIINQPYLAGWRNGQLYLEAHAPLVEDVRQLKGSLKPMEEAVKARTRELPVTVNWTKARRISRKQQGIPVPIGPGGLALKEIIAQAPRVPSVPHWAPENYDPAPVSPARLSEDRHQDNPPSVPNS